MTIGVHHKTKNKSLFDYRFFEKVLVSQNSDSVFNKGFSLGQATIISVIWKQFYSEIYVCKRFL